MRGSTNMKTQILMVVAVVGLAAQALAAALPGTERKDWPANAVKHVVSVTRIATNAVAKQMIAAAEAAPGNRDIWWQGEYRSIKLPYALTKEAVDYYEQVIAAYQKKTFQAYGEPNSSMNYEARVAHHATFSLDGKTYTNVDEVRLKLTIRAAFTEEPTEGVEFTKQRTVVLDATGKVLAITGDGQTEPLVWAW